MIRLYNTYTRKKEEFQPSTDNTVKMYSCGPTVYGFAHMGNFRAYIFMDTLRRVLKINGFNLKGVLNITDVGHLTSDADEGEDKMLKASRAENKTPWEIAEYYTNQFMIDAQKLNIDIPEIVAKATDHIQEMIEFVKGLLEKGYAYEVDGIIYFSIDKFENYGKLSGINLSEQKAGARIEVNENKKNPLDFALWIKAPENHIMKWESPWGLGYPGWHIECSAMGRKYLGDTFDIHTGGIDHIPVHHENEIAQSEALTGKPEARFWMHCAFLNVDGGKMSKSLGNCYTISELEERNYSALDFRYFCLNTHYRKPLNFTFEALNGAKVARERLTNALQEHKDGEEKVNVTDFYSQFVEAINDDLNLPLALGVLWQMIKLPKSKSVYEMAMEMDKVLGLNLHDISSKKVEIPERIYKLAESRMVEKRLKNFQAADRVRDLLKIEGYEITDTKEGYEIKYVEK